jgi:hypothetical protein
MFMKKFNVFVVLLLLSSGLTAQVKTNKTQAKEDSEAKLEAQFQATVQLVESRRFILEADMTTFNFIKIDSASAVLQLGSDAKKSTAYNGEIAATVVGAIDGKVSIWKVTKDDKRKRLTIQLRVTTIEGPYNMFLYVVASGYTEAKFSEGYGPPLRGYIKPLSQARMYKTEPL